MALEAIKARPLTHTTPVLLCPVADWLLAGHEARLAEHHVTVWTEGNQKRLHSAIGDMPPAEFEAIFYRQHEAADAA